MKYLLLPLLLVVGITTNAQRGPINKYTGTYYYFTFPEDKEDSFYAAIPSSDRFVTIRGDTVLNCYKFEIVLGQMGRVAYSKCGSRDTVISNPNALIRLLFGSYRDSRKMIDSLEKLLRDNQQALDSVTFGDPAVQNTIISEGTYPIQGGGELWPFGRNNRSVIDSNGTYHDHMPTQLTVKKRHKRNKWVKKYPPATKD